MRIFDRVVVHPSFDGDNLVEWYINDTYLDDSPLPAGTTFTLQRADAASGPWTDITTVAVSASSAVDDTLTRISTVARWFYRVRINLAGDVDDAVYSHPAPSLGAMDRQSWILAREIRRREDVRMRKSPAGVAGALLQRKRWGVQTADPAIVDFNTGEVRHPRATATVGTAFEGGYHDPLPFYIDISGTATPEIESNEGVGTRGRQLSEGRALAYPIPQTNDVWVACGLGRRYLIREATPIASVRGVPLLIRIRMEVIPPSDIVYSVEIDEAVYTECG